MFSDLKYEYCIRLSFRTNIEYRKSDLERDLTIFLKVLRDTKLLFILFDFNSLPRIKGKKRGIDTTEKKFHLLILQFRINFEMIRVLMNRFVRKVIRTASHEQEYINNRTIIGWPPSILNLRC